MQCCEEGCPNRAKRLMECGTKQLAACDAHWGAAYNQLNDFKDPEETISLKPIPDDDEEDEDPLKNLVDSIFQQDLGPRKITPAHLLNEPFADPRRTNKVFQTS